MNKTTQPHESKETIRQINISKQGLLPKIIELARIERRTPTAMATLLIEECLEKRANQ